MTITITAFERSPDGGKGLARDTRVRWALEEVGQPYEVRLVSFRALKEPAHLTLNPFGKIPTYEEGDLVLFETGAIVLHIADRHRLDTLRRRLNRRQSQGVSVERDRRLIALRLRRGLRSGSFDDGNGEKTLKRWIGLAGQAGAPITATDLRSMIILRPGVRENVFAYLRRADLTASRAKVLAESANSGWFVDDAALVDLTNHLTETTVTTRSGRHKHIGTLIASCDPTNQFGLYCKLWMLSKYGDAPSLLTAIQSSQDIWLPSERLGRLVGSFTPLFSSKKDWQSYFELITQSRNIGARATYKFHLRLRDDDAVFKAMYASLKNPNPSRDTGITHPKFLCLLSALKNNRVPTAQTDLLRRKNSAGFLTSITGQSPVGLASSSCA